MADFDLALPFDTDDREFVRGVQVGMLYGACLAQSHCSMLMYAENAEMVARVRESDAIRALRLDIVVSDTVDWNGPAPDHVKEAGTDWIQVEVIPR